MKARKRIEAVITGTIGNRVVFTGSGVRIPSLPPIKKDTLRVFFFIGERSADKYAATCCRGSHLSNSENPDEGSRLRETAVSRFSP